MLYCCIMYSICVCSLRLILNNTSLTSKYFRNHNVHFDANIASFFQVGLQVPHPGIKSSEEKSEYEYRNFYQYVHFVIFIQAVFFYVPHMIWKNMERTLSGTFEMLKSFNEAIATADESTDKKMDTLTMHIEDRWGSYRLLALKYFFCELLCTMNILVQSYLLDIFFRGKFMGLGLLLETYYSSQFPDDPLRLFPIVTICTFHRYGPSGFIDVIDAMCVLPFNAINAKIYLFLWIWFIILLVLTTLNLLHLLCCIILPIYRRVLLKIVTFQENDIKNTYMQLVTLGDFGDWFLLSAIQKNMDGYDFYRLSEQLLSKLRSIETESKEP